MEKITSVAGLKDAIQILEEDQALKGQLLKEQFFLTYESFKPAKLLGSTLKEMVASPHMIENIIDTSISLATGYFAKRVVAGASSNVLRKLLGSVLQYGVTNFMARNTDAIRSAGKLAFQQIFSRKENSKKP
jgi:hypothetical protein